MCPSAKRPFLLGYDTVVPAAGCVDRPGAECTSSCKPLKVNSKIVTNSKCNTDSFVGLQCGLVYKYAKTVVIRGLVCAGVVANEADKES